MEIRCGTWRVHGTLAVSRSIGDSHLKDWVMAEPETKVICLNPDMKYLILASDGLWEQVRVKFTTIFCNSAGLCIPSQAKLNDFSNGYV